MSDEILEAIADILKEERANTADRLKALDGAHLLKGIFGIMVTMNIQALAAAGDDVMYKKARLVKGTKNDLHPLIREFVAE